MAYKINYCCKNLENYNNGRKRKVAQILDGKVIKVYNSLSSVTKDGFDFSLVSKVCKGKSYKWQYV